MPDIAPLPADWALSAVFMHVDVRGVYDSNGDGIGDLPGLTAKLDHFAQAGIGALLLAGLLPCDFAYAGTMVTDNYSVDPRLGGLADVAALMQAAHARGLAILMVWSPFSTHPDHPAFQASRDPAHPVHAAYADYYLWTDDLNTRLPRRMGHWEWDARRGAYHHCVWLTTDLRWCPEVNLLSPRARAENLNGLRFWLEQGLDGFMLDCAVWGGFTDQAEHVRASREMADLIHSYPNKWVISEGSRSIQDAILTDGYDSFYTHQARSVPILETVFRRPGLGTLVQTFEGMEAHGLHEALYAFYDDPHANQIMNPFELTRPLDFADPADRARLKLAHALHLTLPLIPYTFFPAHLGLTPAYRQDLTRWHPFLMLWDDSPHFGFTRGVPYEPQNVERYPPAAAAASQAQDPDSVLAAFQAVARLRQRRPALQSRHHAGRSYARVPTRNDRDTLAYLRYDPDTGQAVLVAANLAGAPQAMTLGFGRSRRVLEMLGPRRHLTHLAGGGPPELTCAADHQAGLSLPAYAYALYDVD
ncbi:MAG: hypothetical protein IT317_03715 [Anaerolineales bacterium]|nr:hypothetical protein [Anaerolineales bacterium]